MKTNELRIGNYVQHNNRTVGVLSMFNVGQIEVGYKGRTPIVDIEDLEPIPITEQWLLDFGFWKLPDIEDWLIYQKRGMAFSFEISVKDNLLEITESEDRVISVNIYDIHELQNLVFALTGEELTKK